MFNTFGGPAILVLIGGLLVIFGGFWAAAEQNKSQTESDAKTTQLEAKSDQVAKLTAELSATVNGGDGFCYVTIWENAIQTAQGDKSRGHVFVVQTDSKYPLYDLEFSIMDPDAKWKNASWQELENQQRKFHEGTLLPNEAKTLGPVTFSSTGSQKYEILIHTRNKFYTEVIYAKEHKFNRSVLEKQQINASFGYEVDFPDSAWSYAYRVIGQAPSKDKANIHTEILWERIDPSFPLKNGKVEWFPFTEFGNSPESSGVNSSTGDTPAHASSHY